MASEDAPPSGSLAPTIIHGSGFTAKRILFHRGADSAERVVTNMACNLFIAYDLNEPGQNYDAVRDAIKALGPWHQFQYSLFYVHTDCAPAEAYTRVIRVMDGNDRLAVINCADWIGALVTNWDHPPLDAINAIWSEP
jgi:hypothetical protein